MVIFIIIILLLAILMYNQLQREKNQVTNAFSTVSVILKKRYDLIPNLLETVKGYASHEKEVFEKVAEIRANLTNVTNEDRTVKLDNELVIELKSIFAVAENYPELKANKNFLDLQKVLVSLEDELSAARRTYNAAVTEYNTSIQSFPTMLIASMFNMKEKTLFTIDSSEKVAPKISIDK